MWLKQSLPVDSRKIVDEFVDRLSDRNWRERRDEIEHSILSAPFTGSDWNALAPRLQASNEKAAAFAAGALIAAILERLEEQVIVDSDQALVYAMSADIDHQAAACDWFIEQSLVTPIETLSPAMIFDASMTIH